MILTKMEMALMFIGRERELASLKEFYEKDGQEDYFLYSNKSRKK